VSKVIVGVMLLVILSGMIHSIWNLFAKKSINKPVFLWFCQWVAILAFFPFVVMEVSDIAPLPWPGWLLLLASMTIHGTYMLLLAKTYTVGDLSQAYPIMRGISPLLVPAIGVFILHEHLSLIGWSGVLCIVAGIVLIGNFRRGNFSSWFNKTMVLAVSVGLMIASYTVVDKLALTYLPPITLNEACNVANLLTLSWISLRSGVMVREWKVNWRTIILGGLLASGGYILFLKALQLAPVAQLAPMREIGTVFGALLGIFILHEPQGRERIMASILITAGIILLSQA
jgi:drug/metabolite transporter (DMT)-like permease